MGARTPRLGDALSGIALGALVGLLVGMSVSPVVGAVLSGLVALLATYLGLGGAPRPKNNTERTHLDAERVSSNVRVTCFAVGALAAALLGVYIRTQDLLGVENSDRLREWKALGFTERQARDLIAFRELGIVPKTWPPPTDTTAVAVVPDSSGRKGEASVLYGGRADECRDLDPERFRDAGETALAWQQQGGAWAEAGRLASSSVGERERAYALRTIWGLTCQANH